MGGDTASLRSSAGFVRMGRSIAQRRLCPAPTACSYPPATPQCPHLSRCFSDSELYARLPSEGGLREPGVRGEHWIATLQRGMPGQSLAVRGALDRHAPAWHARPEPGGPRASRCCIGRHTPRVLAAGISLGNVKDPSPASHRPLISAGYHSPRTAKRQRLFESIAERR